MQKIIDIFFTKIGDGDERLKNEIAWSDLADSLLVDISIDEQSNFWRDFEKRIIAREERIGHCHKGQIYWRIATIELLRGGIESCVTFLEKSWSEDQIRGDAMSASRGLLSILKPIICPYDRNSNTRLRSQNNIDFYDGMTSEEKREFEQEILSAHNHVAQRTVNMIKPESFKFLKDATKNQIAFDTYYEVAKILNMPLEYYYSCIFSIGSIAEVMLDDLFERNSEEVWRTGNTTSYAPTKLLLGNKIDTLKTLILDGHFLLPKHVVLKLLLICEYRNLIHPNRRHGLEFIPNWYVTYMLFSFISHIASHLWQNNVDKYISGLAKP